MEDNIAMTNFVHLTTLEYCLIFGHLSFSSLLSTATYLLEQSAHDLPETERNESIIVLTSMFRREETLSGADSPTAKLNFRARKEMMYVVQWYADSMIN
jgi:hypothetical protein